MTRVFAPRLVWIFGITLFALVAACESASDRRAGYAAGSGGDAAGSGEAAAARRASANVRATDEAAAAGTAGMAGATGAAGRASTGERVAEAGAAGTPAAGGGASTEEPFSFFVTSYAAIQRLSESPAGFGGDLRYGEADGLSGADKICREIAEASLPGSGARTWRAFLSVTAGPDGAAVHAIDRIGEGPWYDRVGRLVAENEVNLAMTRPLGADASIINDLPNEDGVPNHAPDGMQVDNHDILTGTDEQGQLFSDDWKFTCRDWTSSVGADGTPRVGHSWPRSGGRGRRDDDRGGSTDNWMSALNEAGCAAGASLVEMGPPDPDNPTVGSGGGYGGIYCFAQTP